MKIPTFQDIQLAHQRIERLVHNTPILTSKAINKKVGADIYFKCENFQKVGAFKFRGASNAVACLSKEELKKGVATHSSGNHAAALALAAKQQNIPAHIVMPENAPAIKKQAVAGYGAFITYCPPTLEARESTLQKIMEETGATPIHPYNHFDVICGQGTAAIEIYQNLRNVQIIMTPVGGGGLLSGTAIASKHLSPSTQVIAGEPAGADDAFRSFTTRQFVPSTQPKTIADGLLTSLGSLNFEIIKQHVDAIYTAPEHKIIEAMRLIWERMKIIIEPSSAVPLAAILENPEIFRNKKIAIILTGGNVDLNSLPF
jgi:threonine dehydratase